MLLTTALEEYELALTGVTTSGTRSLYKRRLRTLLEFVGDVEVSTITISQLRRWRAHLCARKVRWENNPYRPPAPGGLSPWTIHSYVGIARRFFNWLVAEGILEESPAARLRLPPLPDEPPKAVSQKDLELLLDAAYDDPRNYAIVCMLADTAARVAAIAGLKKKDLDVENGRAIVHEKGRGGRSKTREVYFYERTQKALRRYLEARSAGQGDTLFLSVTGKNITTNAITQILKRLAKKADVNGKSNPHAFRHGWARSALQNGADLGTVSEMLGHSDIQVTHKFYARWENKELQERHNRFTWMKGKKK